MGRITIFGTNECSHCMRAKGALMVRGIPFVEIDLLQHPRRRADLSSLLLLSKTTTTSSSSSTKTSSTTTSKTQTSKTQTSTVIGMAIPQVFFNEQSIGGADELLARLEEWDTRDGDSTAHSVWEQTIQRQEDPTDPRLAIPTTILPTTKEEQEQEKEKDVGHYLPAITKTHLPLLQIPLPGNDGDDNDDNDDGTSSSSSSCTALELLQRLEQVLDQSDRAYKAHWYKNCFVNTEGVTAIQQEFRLKSRTDAVQFLQRLQRDYQLIHHVCDDHLFRDDGYYFFRLSMYHQPDILNSYLVWNKVVVDKDDHDHDHDHDDPMSLVLDLKRQLYDILSHYTDHNGLIDYVQTAKDARFATLEVAACALQDVDMATMDESTRKAFGLNLYNLFITYAFIKVGIGTSSTWSRGAFFEQVKMNIGGDILSFNDLENGILRANTRHPYASKPPFGVNDERLKRGLPLSQLDCRIHFALNCGAKSCPSIRFFCAGGGSGSGGGGEASLEEELLLVSQAFCQGDDAVCIKEDIQEIQLSMLFKWFQSDFCATKEQLPERLLEFLTGPKRQALERMLQQQQQQQSGTTSRSSSSISIRFLPYDWSANASNFKPYQRSHLRANEYSATALLRFQGHFDSCLSSLSSSSSLAQTTSTSTDAVVSVN